MLQYTPIKCGEREGTDLGARPRDEWCARTCKSLGEDAQAGPQGADKGAGARGAKGSQEGGHPLLAHFCNKQTLYHVGPTVSNAN